MKKLYLMPRLTVLFFILLLPVIILSSMGLRFDFENKVGLNASHNLRLEINNPNFQVSINNQKISQSDIFLPINQLQSFSLSLENHKTENFEVFGSFKNATKINNLSFLPNKPYSSFETTNSILIDKTKLLIQDNNELKILEFNINAEKLGEFKVNGKITENINNLKIQKVGPQFFLDKTNNLAIYYRNGWQIQKLPEFIDFVPKDGLDLFFIDNQNNLGIYNLETQSSIFLGQKASQLAKTVNFTWIYWQNKLIEINNSSLEFKTIVENLNFNLGKLSVAATRNYNFVKLGNSGFLVDKFGNVQTLSLEMLEFVVYDDLIVWITKDSKLVTYNITSKNQFVLVNLPQNLDIKEVKYNLNLSRIFVYTSDSVFSTWFGKELQNFDIVTYPSTKWIENQNCQPEMEGDIQICKDSNRVYFYDSSN